MASIINGVLNLLRREASDMTTTCNHSFHQSCLDEWLIDHNTCPYCRFKLELFIHVY